MHSNLLHLCWSHAGHREEDGKWSQPVYAGCLAEQEGLCPPCIACLYVPEHFKGLREKSLA